jgi:hypothetical protein
MAAFLLRFHGKIMTRQELIDGLQAIYQRQQRDYFDPETDHAEADQLLLDFIDEPIVNDAFDAIEKWYV